MERDDKKKVAASFGNSKVHGNLSPALENLPSFPIVSDNKLNFIFVFLRDPSFYSEK